MIRKLMASSAILALMTAGTVGLAQAQTEPMQQNDPAAMEQQGQGMDQGAADAPAAATDESKSGDAATGTESAEGGGKLQPEQPTLATAFIGKSVFSSQDPEADNIGKVNDLIIDENGEITDAVVGVGGFLGIGEKNVAVPFDELEVSEQDGDLRLIYAATREALQQAPEFDRAAYDPSQRGQQQDTASSGGGMTGGGGMGSTGMGSAGGGMTAAAPTTTPSEPMASSGTDTAANEPAANAPADAAGGADTGDQMASQDQPQDQSTTADQATGGADMAAGANTGTDMTGTDTAGSASDQMAAGESPEGGFVSFSADQVRASTLMGKEVYGEGDQSIGEISDLVLQEDGKTRAALVDVGGFLGVGEKRVAIPFDEIQISQGQDGQQGEEPRLTVAMTRDQLEQAPEWQAPEQQAAEAGGTAESQTGMAAGDQATGQSSDQMAAGTDQQAGQGAEGAMTATAAQDFSADNLLGSAVYGSNDESIGEVDDLVFTPSGDIEAVVVDVGGFLGVGEKPVAIQYDALNVQKDTGGDTRINIDATEEQLKNAPAYDEQTGTTQ